MKSSGKPETIALSVEKYGTLAFINIDVVDADGLLCADAQTPLSVKVEGPAVLAAFGSVKALHHFSSCHRESLRWKSQAWDIKYS